MVGIRVAGLVLVGVLAASSPVSAQTLATDNVTLHPTAAQGFALTEAGMKVSVTLLGAGEVTGNVRDEVVTYPRAWRGVADVRHRLAPGGTEDFVDLSVAPEVAELRYRIAFEAGVAGLRLVANQLELLDRDGTPRLRVAAPYLIDRHDHRRRAQLGVEDCLVDTNPRAPWGRTPLPPLRSTCTVTVRWDVEPEAYPVSVDPAWTATASMAVARGNHTATTLLDGRVLVVGGSNTNDFLDSCELYDPVTDTWSATESLTMVSHSHSAARLDDGRVLLAGGSSYGTTKPPERLYDPATGTWSTTASLPERAAWATLTVLADGRALFVGGHDGTVPNGEKDTAYVFDTNTEQWIPTGSMSQTRSSHRAVGLLDGRVLVVGGGSGASTSQTAELWDPQTEQWTLVPGTVTMGGNPTATRLSDGRVLVFGGMWGGDGQTTVTLFVPGSDTWTPGASATPGRAYHTSGLLPDGRLLTVGGLTRVPDMFNGHLEAVAQAALYDPATDTWTDTAELAHPRASHRMVVLPDGNVLVVGGEVGPQATSTAERYLWRAILGETCVDDTDCDSGHCSDGVCCNTACGDGDPSDCQSCAVASGADVDGICAITEGQTCRASTGECDAAEICGSEPTCPEDAAAPDGQVCGEDGQCEGGMCIEPEGTGGSDPGPSPNPAGGQEVSAGCGCRLATSSGHGAWYWLLGVGLWLVRRRR